MNNTLAEVSLNCTSREKLAQDSVNLDYMRTTPKYMQDKYRNMERTGEIDTRNSNLMRNSLTGSFLHKNIYDLRETANGQS